VQALGKIPVDVGKLGVDLLTITAHKIYGPKGIGALYIRRGVEIENILWGGGQERGRRPGTENVALAVGFAKAVEIGRAEMDTVPILLQSLRARLEIELKNAIPELLVNGHPHERLPHVLNISIDAAQLPLEGETLLMNLDLEGIAVSSGSACTSGSVQPSHVLLAMGRPPATAKATVRFSFGKSNTEDDVGRVVDALKSFIARSRAAAKRT
jgi:cysteine desulfurase